MSTSLVLTIIGPDQPGIVEALATIIKKHEANWEESRMAHLAGRFAGILRVTVAPNRIAALGTELRTITGLTVVVEEGAATPRGELRWINLELTGADHPGIVRDISSTLAALRINVEELETHCEDAPLSGGRLFRARAKLHSPRELALSALRTQLERVAADLMVDVSLSTTEN